MSVGQSRRFASWAIAACVLVGTSTSAQSPASAHSAEQSPLQASHPSFNASLGRLYAGSAAWRQAVDTLASTGRRAVIVTPNQVRVADANGQPSRPFDDDVLAEVQPIPSGGDVVDVVVVVINLDLLETLHARHGRLFDLDHDLDRILAHEVYGHAMPYLIAGHLSGKCADPLPGQRATDACAIQRENEVRMELGLGRRIDYGLNGLALARRYNR